jgi:hypothetical protein
LSRAPGVRSIVGLVEGARGQVQFGTVLRAITIEVLVAAVRLVGIDDLDPGTAKGVEQFVEIFRRGDLRRQQLVDLVIKEISFLLADGDHLAYFVVTFFDGQGLNLRNRY